MSKIVIQNLEGKDIKISQELLSEIQKDINSFNQINSWEQEILQSVLTSNWLQITDKLFNILAQQDNIDTIRDKIEFLIPFLFRVCNFLITQKITIEDLLKNLSFKNEYTKKTLEILFSLESDFLRSIKLENTSRENIDNIEEYKSINLLVDLNEGYFLSSSKININTSLKNIELCLDIEQLETLQKNIENTLQQLKKFQNNFDNKNIIFYK